MPAPDKEHVILKNVMSEEQVFLPSDAKLFFSEGWGYITYMEQNNMIRKWVKELLPSAVVQSGEKYYIALPTGTKWKHVLDKEFTDFYPTLYIESKEYKMTVHSMTTNKKGMYCYFDMRCVQEQ